MNILVMGHDKPVTYLIEMLVDNQHNVLYLDTNPESVNVMTIKEETMKVIRSSGSLIEDLRHAKVDTMELFLAFSNDDNSNIMAAQIASHIFHVPKVLCLIGDIKRSQVYKNLAIEVITPNQVLLDKVLSEIQV